MPTLALCSDSNGTNAYVTSAQIYGKLIADALGCTFTNYSVSGYTSGQISTTVSTAISAGSDWIIACPGTNDFSQAVTSGAKIHDVIKTLCDNVGTMCDNAIAAGKVLTVMSPIFPRTVMQIHELEAERAMWRVCSQKGVDFVPLATHMLNVFSNKQETDITLYYTGADYHGTALWHSMVADLVIKRQHGAAVAPPSGPAIIYQLASQVFAGAAITTPDSPQFAIGTDKFSIEMNIKYTTLGGFLTCQRSGVSNYVLFYNASGVTHFDVVNGSVLANPSWSWSPVIGTTYAIKLERIGNDFKFYVNGSQVSSTVTVAVSIPDYAAPLAIGGDYFTGTGGLYGEITNLKITRG